MSNGKGSISVFQKYLTLWVIICMVVGVLVGQFLPQIPEFLNKFEFAGISIPMAILIWLMMMKVDFLRTQIRRNYNNRTAAYTDNDILL